MLHWIKPKTATKLFFFIELLAENFNCAFIIIALV